MAASVSFASSSISSSVSSSSMSGSTSPQDTSSNNGAMTGIPSLREFFLLGGVSLDKNFSSAMAIACKKQLFNISYLSSTTIRSKHTETVAPSH